MLTRRLLLFLQVFGIVVKAPENPGRIVAVGYNEADFVLALGAAPSGWKRGRKRSSAITSAFQGE